MTLTYQYAPDGVSIMCHDDEANTWTHLQPGAPGWDDWQDGIAAGTITVMPPPPPPPPPPPSPQQQQVDQIVAAGKAALEAAPIETDEGRALAAIVAGALDGLGAIYGTAPGEQP